MTYWCVWLWLGTLIGFSNWIDTKTNRIQINLEETMKYDQTIELNILQIRISVDYTLGDQYTLGRLEPRLGLCFTRTVEDS